MYFRTNTQTSFNSRT